MQIRKQLRNLGDSRARDGRLVSCPEGTRHYTGKGYTCSLGYYHSKHAKTRWKARAKDNGNATGSSKGGQGKNKG
jgi:hypothetical protein